MAARNRKKKQGGDEVEFPGCKKEDPWALVRKLEAQLAQQKFFHEKTKSDHQYEIKTLQAKVRNLEKQRKAFLEKLEQNPIDQQNKLEKELNDTSRQLRETTQKLVTSQQQVDKLLRSNRGIKKAKEKMAEEFLDIIESKNALIHKLEARIRDLRISPKAEDVQVHRKTDPEESNDCWQPSDTMEMWDHSNEDITQQVEEEKERTEDQCNMNVSKTLEEKNKVVDCTVSFFPSMYDGNGNERDKQSCLYQKGFPNLPTNSETNYKTHMNEQLSAATQSKDENAIIIDETQNQTPYNFPFNKLMVQRNNGEQTNPNVPAAKLKCWTKAKMDNIARHNKVCHNKGGDCACITRLRYFYSRITLGSKADATEDIPGVHSRPPPPGFHTFDTRPAMHAGIDFLNPSCCEPAENKASAQNVK